VAGASISRSFIRSTQPVPFQPADDAASLPFVIDAAYTEPRRYADEVERDGLTMGFHSWHRPLSHYTGSLHRAGFVIEVMEEVTDPDPSDTWSRIPLFLHVIARRDGR
jgi:hypothetical protein